jgi:hypothetical protein
VGINVQDVFIKMDVEIEEGTRVTQNLDKKHYRKVSKIHLDPHRSALIRVDACWIRIPIQKGKNDPQN